MSVRARRNAGTSWRRALALSLGLHAVLLLALGMGAFATSARLGGASISGGMVPAVAETLTQVDLAAVDLAAVPELTTTPTPVSPPDLSTAPFADQARAISQSAVVPAAGGADHRSPASDRGADRGRAVEDPAWRRDATTLHERLTDGAETYQPSHARTASRATSPQAVRREPVTGLGDSTQTHRAQRNPVPARYGVVDPDGLGLGAATSDGVPAEPSVVPNPAVPEAQRQILASSQGPLTAEQGTRSFDVESSWVRGGRQSRAAGGIARGPPWNHRSDPGGRVGEWGRRSWTIRHTGGRLPYFQRRRACSGGCAGRIRDVRRRPVDSGAPVRPLQTGDPGSRQQSAGLPQGAGRAPRTGRDHPAFCRSSRRETGRFHPGHQVVGFHGV